ncbi:hypothetical protein GUJ93_ZPchr0002g24943 [Zizania palustris]|uniref:Uncharacterized protein n=1 Tax=Zizania palustris TaxID=103762 RepID=A0A8J5S9B8_ZIZPA|nr:hypothetical protein GUJ93_ZPchr0002g24943 [Zizania palustris]
MGEQHLTLLHIYSAIDMVRDTLLVLSYNDIPLVTNNVLQDMSETVPVMVTPITASESDGAKETQFSPVQTLTLSQSTTQSSAGSVSANIDTRRKHVSPVRLPFVASKKRFSQAKALKGRSPLASPVAKELVCYMTFAFSKTILRELVQEKLELNLFYGC